MGQGALSSSKTPPSPTKRKPGSTKPAACKQPHCKRNWNKPAPKRCKTTSPGSPPKAAGTKPKNVTTNCAKPPTRPKPRKPALRQS